MLSLLQGGLPSWTFQPSALQDLWCHQPDSDVADLDWSMMLPQYSPSLVPLVEGLPGMEVLLMLSSQDIIDATTGKVCRVPDYAMMQLDVSSCYF